MLIKRHLPFAVALLVGVLALAGILLDSVQINNLIMNWASFLAAAALLLGILNLFAVHIARLVGGRNLYSGVLVLSMIAVFGLAIADSEAVGLTKDGVTAVFNWVQAPLEAALASLLAFFLLFAGFRVLQKRRSSWSLLFLFIVLFMLVSGALVSSALLPAETMQWLRQIRELIDGIIVTAGMRGILIGVAMGTIMISLRLLAGLERPYSS